MLLIEEQHYVCADRAIKHFCQNLLSNYTVWEDHSLKKIVWIWCFVEIILLLWRQLKSQVLSFSPSLRDFCSNNVLHPSCELWILCKAQFLTRVFFVRKLAALSKTFSQWKLLQLFSTCYTFYKYSTNRRNYRKRILLSLTSELFQDVILNNNSENNVFSQDWQVYSLFWSQISRNFSEKRKVSTIIKFLPSVRILFVFPY